MGSGGGKTTVEQSDPWAGQQPYLRRGFSEAERLYNQGGPQFYPESTVVPFSGQTEMALAGMQDRALRGSPVDAQMQSYVQGAMANPGGVGAQNYLTGVMGQNPTLGQTSGYADAASVDPARQMLQSFDGSSPSFGQSGIQIRNALSDTMNQGATNPFLDRQYDAAARRVTENFTDAVMPSLNASFAGSGGSNSGIQRELALDASDELGQNLSDMAANIYGNNYQQDQSRRLQAAGLLSSDDINRAGLNANVYNNSQNRALTGAQTQLADNLQRLNLGADLFNQFGNRGVAAANTSGNILTAQHEAAGRAAALAPTASNQDYVDLARLAGVGGSVEDMAGQILGDRIARYDHAQNLPYNNLTNYMANIYGNVGSVGGSRSVTGPGGSRLAGGLGGAMSGVALASMLGGGFGAAGGAGAGAQAGSGAGPWGMAAGAILGGLLGSRG